jgi:hypothetical protein
MSHRGCKSGKTAGGNQSTLNDSMTTGRYPSQAEEDDEEIYYGTPTHSCRHCSRTFTATWTEDHTRLNIDLVLNREDSEQAAQDGCVFFRKYAKDTYDKYENYRYSPPITTKTTVQLWLEKECVSPA